MANELKAAYNASGLTITARVYLNGVQQGSDVSCSEVGTTGFYQGNMPALSLGSYDVLFFRGTETTASADDVIHWDGSDPITIEVIHAYHNAKHTVDPTTGELEVRRADDNSLLVTFDLTNDAGGVPTALDSSANAINRTPQ